MSKRNILLLIVHCFLIIESICHYVILVPAGVSLFPAKNV